MQERLAIGAGILALTLLSFFQFPGHTYLGSDTQIYVPMMERIWDPSVLARDLVAGKPHVSFTLYDEIAIGLRWITHGSFQAVLTGQQIVYRALQILGVFLLALSFPLTRGMAMLVTALYSLGATIAGPAVLTFEYEPVPRGFAIALLFLAIGLVAQNHLMLADIAAALAFLYHPPTVVAFWALYLWLTLRHRDYRDLWPLAAAVVFLFVASRLQPGATESQVFFSRVSTELERLQRMRASYNWLSTWPPQLTWQYPFLWLVSLIAFWRVQPKAARLFLIGMPALGILSMPLSYLLLDKLKWGLIPQLQPARAVLFVTAFAVILGAAAGIRAAEKRRWIESIVWFAIVLAVPAQARLFNLLWPNLKSSTIRTQFLLVIGMAAVLTCALYFQRFRWARWLAIGAAAAPFFLLPTVGQVRNYRKLDLSGIEDLAKFARDNTSKDVVFLFGDAEATAYPSIFRAEALRAVYVDAKAGGLMNYHESIGTEWWQRWESVNELRFDPSEVDRLPGLGIDYLVLGVKHRLPNGAVVHENAQYVVYDLSVLHRP